MISSHVDIAMRSCDYGEAMSLKAKVAPSNGEPLHIERPTFEPIPQMSKGPMFGQFSVLNC